MNKTASQRGFTLVELMVGLALGSFIILGALTATTGLLKGDSVRAARLSQELRSTAFLFERDVMRAGFTTGAAAALATGPGGYVNPFSRLDTSTAGCVLFSYDANQSGTQETAGSDERFAYALANGVLYIRTSGAAYNCDTTQGVWQAVTDGSMANITQFSVSVVELNTAIPNSTKFVRTRTLMYQVTAAPLTGGQSSPQSFANTVKLPNDIVS